MMKRLISSFVLGMAVVCFSSTAYAQGWVYKTVDFEEFAEDIGKNSAWGGRTGDHLVTNDFPDNPPQFIQGNGPILWGFMSTMQTQYTSQGATFNHYAGYDGGYGMGFWGGMGLSTRDGSSNAGTSYTNEMESITGSGYGGSQTYGVAFMGLAFSSGFDINDPFQTPIVSFDQNVWLQSIAITMTTYTQDHIQNGTGFGPAGDTLDLLIRGYDADWNIIGTVSQKMDDLTDWAEVNLMGLTNVAYLAFAFDGRVSSTPYYFAFDNLVYAYWDPNAIPVVPEPATLAVLGLGLAGLAVARRRRK